MKTHLDYKIRYTKEIEYNSLYEWCLQEIDENGTQNGRDWVPWAWTLHFTSSEIRLVRRFEYRNHIHDLNEIESGVKKSEITDEDYIMVTLHPGISENGKYLSREVKYSMMGTNRTVRHISLRIHPVENIEDESCRLWGSVADTIEIDFRDIHSPDCLEFYVGVSKDKFEKIANIALTKSADVINFSISAVHGFYSDWSPSITTDLIKIIAPDNFKNIEFPINQAAIIPKLGSVGEFSLALMTRHTPDLRQDLRPINIENIFGDEYGLDEEVEQEINLIEESRERMHADITGLLAQIALIQNQTYKAIAPLWILITLVLVILVFL